MFSFGKRKIKAMNYTRNISLPKDWLRFHGLERDDEVEVWLTASGNLLIKPLNEEKPQTASSIPPPSGSEVAPPSGSGVKEVAPTFCM